MDEKIYNDTAHLINELFLDLKAKCPAWPQSWPNAEIEKRARQIWLEALIKNQIHNWQHVKKGISKIKTSFIPSIEDFISFCKPSINDLNIPTVQEAYKEACNNAHPQAKKKWSHAIVFNAALNTGYDKLNNLSLKESYPIFAHNYEVLVNRMMKNEPLGREILVAIPEKIEPPSTKETGKEWLSKVKDLLK